MHVVARGALIGGGVGAALALLRPGKGEGAGRGLVRAVKSIAEGALAGAGVGILLDRRLRARAGDLLAEHAPAVLDALEVARTRSADLLAA